MSKTKKKVIALVIDTELTNEEIETGGVSLSVLKDGIEETVPARNVRVLDSD